MTNKGDTKKATCICKPCVARWYPNKEQDEMLGFLELERVRLEVERSRNRKARRERRMKPQDMFDGK